MKRSVFALILSLTIFSFPSIASEEDSVSATSVSFGATFPATGVKSPGVSSYYSGIDAYFAFVNENGGIYGRKIDLLRKDDRGTAGGAIATNSELINKDKVFGFISTAPSCQTQASVMQIIRARGIPSLFVDCFREMASEDVEQPTSDAISTSYYNKIRSKNQIMILKSYADQTFPNQKIAVIYQSDENASSISTLAGDPRIACSRSFIAGSEQFSLNPIIANCTNGGALKDGDLVIYSGSSVGLGALILFFERAKLRLRYLATDDAVNTSVFSQVGLPVNYQVEIYAVSSNALVSETSNKVIATFLSIGQKYQGNNTLDQQFLNGMNVGYIICNVLGAVGPDLNRERFMKAMDMYGALFDVLGLSERSQEISTRFMPFGGVVVKRLGQSSEAVSEVITLDKGKISLKPRRLIDISPKGLPILAQQLPNSTTTPQPTPQPTTSKPLATSSSPEIDLDGEEESPFGKIYVKKDKNKYIISISSNLPNENLQVRATKKGQKAISFRIATNDDGMAKFRTTRSLSGFQVGLLLDGEILSSVKAN